MSYKLSVVVCSYDRYEILQIALTQLLQSASFATASVELLVVENTPKAKREEIDLPALPNARVVICEETGLSAARNCGIAHAAGEYIAFLDDDALVGDHWCQEIITLFDDNPKIKIAGGKVVPLYASQSLPRWYDEKLSGYLSCIDWGTRGRFLRAGEWIVGANMAYRKSVFSDFGLFDTQLGRKGEASLLSNEEISLLERVGIQRVWYEPKMLVQHMIPSSRLTPKWFRRRVYWQAVSDMVAGLNAASEQEMRQEFGVVVSQLDPEHRNIDALHYEPSSQAEFALQLRAVYLAAIVMGGGGL